MAFKATCTTLAKVADDEPIFVLRAKDSLAAQCVMEWIEWARYYKSVPAEKLAEAEACVVSMREWAEKNGGARLPD